MEQALVLGVGGLGLALGILLVLAVAASLVVRATLPRLERRLDADQVELLATIPTPVTEPSPAGRNRTADRLEAAAAELGISLAPDLAPRRPRPTPEAARTFADIADAFPDPRQPLPWAAASRYAAWRSAEGPRLTSLVEAVLAGDPPRWGTDSDNVDGEPDIDLDGMRRLQQVLITEAWCGLIERNPTATSRNLEAAWRLVEPILTSPALAAQETAVETLEQLLTVLRASPDPADGWDRRLTAVDPVAGIRRAYILEGRRLRRHAEATAAYRVSEVAFLVRPFAKLLLARQQETLLDGVPRLSPADAGEFDPGAFAASLDSTIPRWNRIARRAMPASWEGWPRSVHAALAIDLTRRTLVVRQRCRAAGVAALRRLPASWPEPLTGGAWGCRVGDRQVTIFLDPDRFPEHGQPALEQVVSVGADRVARGAS